MNFTKLLTLSALIVAASAIGASAEQTASAPTQPPQIAALPGASGADSGQTAAGAGHWVWVPHPTSPYVTNGATGVRTDHGQFYSKKGFGPTPN